jgi:pimeloyl-ACP methyl ester carboxylesterase
MQTHHTVPLAEIPGGYALLSNQLPKRTAAVFIHGFDGDPSGTWQHLQSMLDLMAVCHPWILHTDFYFYGYTNFDTLLQANAQECLAFIRRVFPSPRIELFNTSVLGWSFSTDQLQQRLSAERQVLVPDKYERLLLVGHSLGGALLRLAVWEAFRDAVNANPPAIGQQYPDPKFDGRLIDTDQFLSADLCLFAPAHLEISESSVLGVIARILRKIPYFGEVLLGAIGLALPVFPTVSGGDQVLSDVRNYTEGAWDQHRYVPALRARIMWGGSDRIVNAWGFKHDSPVEYVNGVGHMTICKPSWDFTRPFDFLSYGYKRDTAAH